MALPGVGQGLMDHPSIALAAFVKPFARINDTTRRHIMIGWRYSSEMGGAPAGDMFVTAATKSSWHSVGEQIAALILFVNKTYSETGQVKLTSRDWRSEPLVEFNLLSDKRDLDLVRAELSGRGPATKARVIDRIGDPFAPRRQPARSNSVARSEYM